MSKWNKIRQVILEKFLFSITKCRHYGQKMSSVGNSSHGPLIYSTCIVNIYCFYVQFKVILHQFWVKKCFPWKFNLEYGGTFTKLFMHVSSRNMFPTIRNLQIRVHVYRPRHCCGDWLTFGCFVLMIADHDLVTKR